jgi:superfamily I DNA/RNA helicase
METTWWTQPEQLDDEQREVVALDLDRDHLVIGPPGSGKTNLLILRAAHLYGAGCRNIVLLTFGRVLREFLVAGSANYMFPKSKIQTYLQWGSRLLSINEQNFDEQGKFKQKRAKLFALLQELASQSNPENIHDCILIDEVQDYTREEIGLIRTFARHIFAVGDNRQRLYQEDGSLDVLKASIPSLNELHFHYRNGIKICRLADGIRALVDSPDGLQASSNYDESNYPSTVISRGNLTISAQVVAAVPDITTQLRAYPDGMIGVLSPRHEELDQVWTELSSSTLADQTQLQRYSDGYAPFDLDRRIVVTTAHGAKGLEFRALHLFGMDKISKFRLQRNIAYTAVTRAKTSLAIYHEDSLPGYVETGLVAARGGVIEAPPLDKLFRKL